MIFLLEIFIAIIVVSIVVIVIIVRSVDRLSEETVSRSRI